MNDKKSESVDSSLKESSISSRSDQNRSKTSKPKKNVKTEGLKKEKVEKKVKLPLPELSYYNSPQGRHTKQQPIREEMNDKKSESVDSSLKESSISSRSDQNRSKTSKPKKNVKTEGLKKEKVEKKVKLPLPELSYYNSPQSSIQLDENSDNHSDAEEIGGSPSSPSQSASIDRSKVLPVPLVVLDSVSQVVDSSDRAEVVPPPLEDLSVPSQSNEANAHSIPLRGIKRERVEIEEESHNVQEKRLVSSDSSDLSDSSDEEDGERPTIKRRFTNGRNVAFIDNKGKANPKVFGRIKGIKVGHHWKTRMECSRDSVHAPPVAGISGNTTDGCYSVAVSGGYEDDLDEGYRFVYTGSGGRDLRGTIDQPKNLRTAQQSFDQEWGSGNLAIKCSVMSGKPIRVIRGYKGTTEWAPDSGYRYDGLYRAVATWKEEGKSGFKVIKFAFKRIKGQKPIILEGGIESKEPDYESAEWKNWPEDDSLKNRGGSTIIKKEKLKKRKL
eukprot:TRINITY_DN1800_c0_g1_i1.p1 TRINITY_DN1800_c0_g1~~TRINITY_DN1800_c0_g1_i1.p1  ORF type:complete len:517 (-),score=175.90 TRINITY_DN1800_c0_g1_i1:2735-4228(-)